MLVKAKMRRFLWQHPRRRALSSLPAASAVQGDPKTRSWGDVNTNPRNNAHDHATYEFLLQRLYQVNKFTAVKLGIDNVRQLNAAFGDPSSKYEVIHVAGTNGKGSVSYKIAKVYIAVRVVLPSLACTIAHLHVLYPQALEKSGYTTGLFVSPHVSCFRERIQINGELISEEEVVETLSEVFNVSAQLRIPATFFEITTMLAFQHFAKRKVDCVVLETGLGGRLDATNIVTPTLSVITSIGMDHMRILGNTIPEIASEKAGIMKPNVPVVLGPQAPLEHLIGHAKKAQSPLVQVPMEAAFIEDFNAENTAISRLVCEKLNELVGKKKSKVSLALPGPYVKWYSRH